MKKAQLAQLRMTIVFKHIKTCLFQSLRRVFRYDLRHASSHHVLAVPSITVNCVTFVTSAPRHGQTQLTRRVAFVRRTRHPRSYQLSGGGTVEQATDQTTDLGGRRGDGDGDGGAVSARRVRTLLRQELPMQKCDLTPGGPAQRPAR